MIALCSKCNELNDFQYDITGLDYCRKCGATNIDPNFRPYNKVNKHEKFDEGIPEPKEQKQYQKPIGKCKKCGRHMTLYSVKNQLCQNCYRVDLEQRKELKQRLG